MRTRFEEASPAETPQTSAVSEVADDQPAGQQLDHARAADRKWRGAFALRLYRWLGRLLKASKVFQVWGLGVSGLLLLAGLVAPFCFRDLNTGMNLCMWLLLGTIVCVFGTSVGIGLFGGCLHVCRNWIARMGLREEWVPGTEELMDEASSVNWLIEMDSSVVLGASKVLGVIVRLVLGALLLFILWGIVALVAGW